jgi:RNA polymerase sigma-70 factor (ECF subfamily)
LNSETFTNLYRNAYPRLVAIAAALVSDRSEACDIVQQAAIIAIERFDQFAPREADAHDMEFARWMTVIVRNVAANERRKNQRRRAVPFTEADTSAQPPVVASAGHRTTAQGIDFDQQSRQIQGLDGAFDDKLRKALQTLSETSRICLLLHVVQHLTLEEIALLLAIPPGTVASHVSRAKKALRDLLSDYRGSAK